MQIPSIITLLRDNILLIYKGLFLKLSACAPGTCPCDKIWDAHNGIKREKNHNFLVYLTRPLAVIFSTLAPHTERFRSMKIVIEPAIAWGAPQFYLHVTVYSALLTVSQSYSHFQVLYSQAVERSAIDRPPNRIFFWVLTLPSPLRLPYPLPLSG
jgi:hypothetical protein